jgi:hypothetical protein
MILRSWTQAAKLTVKLDGDVIMGDYITDKRYHSEGMGSIEDIRYCACINRLM